MSRGHNLLWLAESATSSILWETDFAFLKKPCSCVLYEKMSVMSKLSHTLDTPEQTEHMEPGSHRGDCYG